jgi:hypothetical protein
VVVVGARRAGIVAVVLAALTMGLAFAHTLELPQKVAYDAATWTQVQHSLYRYFAVVGGPLEVATVIAVVVFAVRARGRRGGRLAVVGAALFVLALGWWFAVTFAGFLALLGATVRVGAPDHRRVPGRS